YSWRFDVVPVSARSFTIQGAGHLSPLNGQPVADVPGVVTARRANGFYMQDPLGDGDPASSDGIFVLTSSTPPASPRDRVTVGGAVGESRPGGASGDNLTVTQLLPPSVAVASTGGGLPVAVVLTTDPARSGAGLRRIPTGLIADARGDVEASRTFDP